MLDITAIQNAAGTCESFLDLRAGAPLEVCLDLRSQELRKFRNGFSDGGPAVQMKLGPVVKGFAPV